MKETINDIITRSVDEGSTVGADCMVIKDSNVLFSGAFGFADREGSVPMTMDAVFRLFSLTKPVTAAAVMVLFDRGLLSPDQKLKDFFPEFSSPSCLNENQQAVPCGTDITIAHLLTMTSGIPYANSGNPSVDAAGRLFDAVIEGQENHQELSTLDFCRKAGSIPLSFVPGEKWDYGISADILGGVVEKVSGMRYSRFLEENIFAPLGMKDTGFYVPEEKTGRFTALYRWDDGKLVRDYGNYLGLTDYSAPPAFESGGAGLVSTIRDYSRFACMLAGKGEFDGVRIISEKAFEYMTAPRLGQKQKSCLWPRLAGYNYGALMRVMTDVSSSEIKTCNGEFGWDGWTGTYFCADPVNRIVVLYFTQIAGAGTTFQAAKISEAAYRCLSSDQ